MADEISLPNIHRTWHLTVAIKHIMLCLEEIEGREYGGFHESGELVSDNHVYNQRMWNTTQITYCLSRMNGTVIFMIPFQLPE